MVNNNVVCLKNYTFDDVEPKYRVFIKEAICLLSKSTTFINMNDGWELRIHTDYHINETGSCKYLLLFWDAPYTFYIEIYPNKGISFKIVDSDSSLTILNRYITDMNLPLKEIEFFIDSVKNYFNIKNKLDKFVNKYEECNLPLGYLRSEKIKQILK